METASKVSIASHLKGQDSNKKFNFSAILFFIGSYQDTSTAQIRQREENRCFELEKLLPPPAYDHLILVLMEPKNRKTVHDEGMCLYKGFSSKNERKTDV